MTYTLHVHAREAEPYTGLCDYEAVREAVEEEARNTINDLGSAILNEGTEEERDLVVELMADQAMESLWRPNGAPTEYRLPGDANGRHGVRLSLEAIE